MAIEDEELRDELLSLIKNSMGEEKYDEAIAQIHAERFADIIVSIDLLDFDKIRRHFIRVLERKDINDLCGCGCGRTIKENLDYWHKQLDKLEEFSVNSHQSPPFNQREELI